MVYAIGGGVAAVVAFVEAYSRLESRFTLRNWAWWPWLLRISLELGAAAVAFGILALAKVPNRGTWVAGVLVGCAAPALLRMRVLDLGKDEESKPYGPALLYERVRPLLDGKINDRSAGAEVAARFRLLPAMERAAVDPVELGRFMTAYLKRCSLSPAEKAQHVAYVESTVQAEMTDRTKRETLADYAMQVKAWSVLRLFMKESKRREREAAKAEKKAAKAAK